jgi:hypothetical protein
VQIVYERVAAIDAGEKEVAVTVPDGITAVTGQDPGGPHGRRVRLPRLRIRWKRKRGTNKWRVETNQAADFPTMLPHAIGSAGGPRRRSRFVCTEGNT